MVGKLPWTWFDYRADPPKWLLEGIGRIAVEWTILERELEELVRVAADVSIQTGRIVTLGMSARSRLQMARDLIQFHAYNDKLDEAFLGEIDALGKIVADGLGDRRNMVVHGLWDTKEGDWHVLRTTGQRDEPALAGKLRKLRRAVLPKSEKFTRQSINKLAAEIAVTGGRVVKLCSRIAAARPASPHQAPEYRRRRRRATLTGAVG